jgi:hypothetical protein
MFNTFLVASALALAIVVLEREERYALGQMNEPAAAEQAAQQDAMTMAQP